MTDEELKQEIEKVKQKIADYTRIAPLLGITSEDNRMPLNGHPKTLSHEKSTRYFSGDETINGLSRYRRTKKAKYPGRGIENSSNDC